MKGVPNSEWLKPGSAYPKNIKSVKFHRCGSRKKLFREDGIQEAILLPTTIPPDVDLSTPKILIKYEKFFRKQNIHQMS